MGTCLYASWKTAKFVIQFNLVTISKFKANARHAENKFGTLSCHVLHFCGTQLSKLKKIGKETFSVDTNTYLTAIVHVDAGKYINYRILVTTATEPYHRQRRGR